MTNHFICVSIYFKCVISNGGGGLSLSRSYGSWIYNYRRNKCLLPLKLWVRMSLMVRCTRNNNMKSLPLTCGMACRWFSPDSAVSSINKTDRHGITEILFKLALKTITLTISNTIGPLNKYLRVDNYKIASNSKVFHHCRLNTFLCLSQTRTWISNCICHFLCYAQIFKVKGLFVLLMLVKLLTSNA